MRRDRNVRRWVDRHTGMCKTLVSLDPLTDAQAWTAINGAIAAARATNQTGDERSWDQLVADVVVDLLRGGGTATGDRAGGGGERAVPEVSVLIDYSTLVEGDHSASTCETADGQPLPVETIRRLCCEGDIVPIVLGGHGEILDVGHHRRLTSRAQRRALRCPAAAPTRNAPSPSTPAASTTLPGGNPRSHQPRQSPPALRDAPPPRPRRRLDPRLHPDRRTVWSTPDGTIHYDVITTDRRPHAGTVTESDQPCPHPPRRHTRRAAPSPTERTRPHRAPTHPDRPHRPRPTVNPGSLCHYRLVAFLFSGLPHSNINASPPFFFFFFFKNILSVTICQP